MKIQKASEDYLESMLMMKEQHGYIRSIDVADHLGVTKPSVTYATKRLRENGYIEMDRDGLITLTDRGMAIAAKMLDRHHTLTKFLIALGVDEKTAEEDACKIEHDISQQTYDAICEHVKAAPLNAGSTAPYRKGAGPFSYIYNIILSISSLFLPPRRNKSSGFSVKKEK